MADLTKILGGPWTPPADPIPIPFEYQLSDAMRDAGLEPPEEIRFDAGMQRWKPDGKSDSGWYIAFGDGIPAGRFGDWKSGIDVMWRADIGRKLTPIEEINHNRRMAAAKALRDEQIKAQRQVAAETAEQIWESAKQASGEHPYLARKGIKPHGVKVAPDGRIVLPLCDKSGAIKSLQYIDANGGKLFHKGGEAGGKFWVLGTPSSAREIYIAEGFATAATIREATGCACVISFSASNLPAVVESLREMYGIAQDIVIVADHDRSGIGKKYAEIAASKHGARVVIPPIEGMDANDYAQAGHDLRALLAKPSDSGVIDKLRVVFGDALPDDYEAPDELVEGLITSRSLTVIYGDSNSGKTFWAMSVATAIANGDLCYGRKTDPGLVIYLASEAPGSIRSRMQAIKRYHGCNLENLAMVPVPVNFYAGDQDARDVIELVRAVEQLKAQPVRLIIGDTLARMSAGANENSGEDMAPVMARFDEVAAATGAAVMIIHHTGKDAARGARGWSGIRAHIDTELEVIEKDGARSVTITKQRELASKGDVIYFRLEVIEMGTTKFGSPATTCVAVNDDDAEDKTPHKKPSKHDENLRTMERAWLETGAEERNGLPYLTRSGLREILMNDGTSKRTAKNKTEPSRQEGFIAPLLNSGVIRAFEQGWLFVNDTQVSAMLLRKTSRNICP
jgi:putative DNA primase/helicase